MGVIGLLRDERVDGHVHAVCPATVLDGAVQVQHQPGVYGGWGGQGVGGRGCGWGSYVSLGVEGKEVGFLIDLKDGCSAPPAQPILPHNVPSSQPCCPSLFLPDPFPPFLTPPLYPPSPPPPQAPSDVITIMPQLNWGWGGIYTLNQPPQLTVSLLRPNQFFPVGDCISIRTTVRSGVVVAGKRRASVDRLQSGCDEGRYFQGYPRGCMRVTRSLSCTRRRGATSLPS